MAEENVISFVGGRNQAFAGVTGDDGQGFTFWAGQQYAQSEVPDSVLQAIDDGIPGHEFETGSESDTGDESPKAAEKTPRSKGD